jgi:broad specificity phosphatase PhoE
MATLLLARHGETDWNRDNRFQGHTDTPLNERGRAQASDLAAELARDQPIAAIYASPLRRAYETATIVGDSLALQVTAIPELREIDTGEWSGLTQSEIEKQYPDAWARWREYGRGWERGETYGDLGRRVVPALLSVGERHAGARILVVTHGGVIRTALAYAAGIPYEQARRLSPVTANCSLTALELDGTALRRLA